MSNERDHGIGFLAGSGGNATGIGDYVRALDAAGLSSVTMANDETKGIGDALALIDAGSEVEHEMLFRVVRDGSEYYAVPNYDLSPDAAAIDYWHRIRPEISTDVWAHPAVSIAMGNELDKNRADWLGWWAVASIALLDAEGRRGSFFGFSSGEPEPEHWETPGMLALFRMMARRPGWHSLNLHEYSYSNNYFWEPDPDEGAAHGYPWNIGRFQFALQAADKHAIARPKILVGEWFTTLGSVPPQDRGLRWWYECAQLYAAFGVKAGGWTLQNWHTNIYNQLQKYIAPVTEQALNFGYDAAAIPVELVVPIEPGTPVDPPIDPPIEPPAEEWPQPAGNTRGLDLVSFGLSYGNSFQTFDRVWFEFLYRNGGETDRRYEGMGALISRWDPGAGVLSPVYYQHSYNGTIDAGETGPPSGAGDPWRDGWEIPAQGMYRFQPLLSYDPTCRQKTEAPETLVDSFAMGPGFWVEIKNAPEQGSEIEDPRPAEPVEPPVDPGVKQVIWLYPQEYSEEEAVEAARGAYREYKRVLGASHHAAAVIETSGNAQSYVVVLDPDRESQRFAMAEFDEWGVAYQERYFFDDPTQPEPEDPLAGLVIAAPFRVEFAKTSDFNDPREYGNGLHEGVDYDVIGGPAESTEPVLCGVTGTVMVVGEGGAYGLRVYIDFTYNNVPCTISYCHLDSIDVSLGQVVTPGVRIGELGGTGGDFAEHVHINLQVPYGADGYVIPNVIDPAPYISMDPQAHPPPQGLDLAPFVFGDGRRYYLRSAAGHQELLQTQITPSRRYQVKNESWESFFIADAYIYRDTDTSAGGGRYYTLRDVGGVRPASIWLPRVMAIGESFKTGQVQVQFYEKSNCQPSAPNSGVVQDTRRLVALHENWESRFGFVVPRVAEIEWVNGGELYFYGEGYGLVGWERKHQDPVTPAWTSLASEPEGGNSTRETGCFGGHD